MKVKYNGTKVDVLDAACLKRACFELFFDKGTYSPGRGYTKYYTDSRGRYVAHAVCGRRHLSGCPVNSICPVCRIESVIAAGAKCPRPECTGVMEDRHV